MAPPDGAPVYDGIDGPHYGQQQEQPLPELKAINGQKRYPSPDSDEN